MLFSTGKQGQERQALLSMWTYYVYSTQVWPLLEPVLFADEESWEAEGLKLDLIEPMKKWSITYEGPMVHQVNKTTHHVKLEVSL